MTKVEEIIDYFCEYFADQAKVISALVIDDSRAEGTDQEHHQIRFYQKALLITHIDTLAGIRYTEKRYPQLNRKNKDRFIQFLETSAAWPEGQLVSIPFLEEYIKSGKIGSGRLKEHIEEKLAGANKEGSFNINAKGLDDSIDFLLGLSSTEQEEKAIFENRHYELLYRYRNYLVHESREPGKAMEVTPEHEAYYHGYIGDDRLYLAYPINLFLDIYHRSLEYVRAYLMRNKIDPYNYVKETVRW